MLQFNKITWGGWENCHRLSNGTLELIVTGDVGARIISFGAVGGVNLFKTFEDQLGRVGDAEWNIYGGHRLWAAPEVMPRTYYPDNASVSVQVEGEAVTFLSPIETTTHLQKAITVKFIADAPNQVEVIHTITNHNLWAVELAPWSLTVMAEGGVGIMPLPKHRSHDKVLLPTHTLALWSYTDLSDPRWTWGSEYILLRQSRMAHTPQKIGAHLPNAWLAYALEGYLFVKHAHYTNGTYPDMNCNVEMFTDPTMLELETLAPLTSLQPQAHVTHVERWALLEHAVQPHDERDVKSQIAPAIANALDW